MPVDQMKVFLHQIFVSLGHTYQNSAGEHEQGFLTNDNRFVERDEAAEIAFRCGQIKGEKKYLFSEDVW